MLCTFSMLYWFAVNQSVCSFDLFFHAAATSLLVAVRPGAGLNLDRFVWIADAGHYPISISADMPSAECHNRV